MFIQGRNKASYKGLDCNLSAHSGLAVRGAGLEAVVHLLASARRLEILAMVEQANRLRKLADLVAAEYCHVAPDNNLYSHQTPPTSIECCSAPPFGPGQPALAPLVGEPL